MVKFIHDNGIIPNNPTVVSRFNHVRVASLDIDLGSIVMAHSHSTGNTGTYMVDLAALTTNYRFNAVGPTPSWLHCELSDFNRAKIQDRNISFIGGAGLVWR